MSGERPAAIPIQDDRPNKSQGGLGVGEAGDPAYTLTTQDRQAVFAFDQYNQSMNGETHQTLRTGSDSHGVVVFEPGAMSRLDSHEPSELAPTLRAHMGDNQPAVLIPVLGGQHPCASSSAEGLVPTLTAASGMGGGHTPLIADVRALDDERTPTGNLTPWPEMGQANMVYDTNGPTRTVDANRHLILEESEEMEQQAFPMDLRNATRKPDSPQGVGLGEDGQPSPTLTVGFVPGVGTRSIVRRLTPMECERLQGFPDGWTGEQTDGHRYKQMGNAVAVPVVNWIVAGIAGG